MKSALLIVLGWMALSLGTPGWQVGLALAKTPIKSHFTPDESRPEEKLYTYSYFVDEGRPTDDAIIFIQGRNEFIGMYEHVANSFLGTYQTDVFLFDLRGQGQSSGVRCHIDSYDQYLSDLHSFINHLKDQYGYTNIHISAHSTGGLIASLFAAKYPGDFGPQGSLVLGSPFIDFQMSGMMKNTIWLLSNALSLTSWSGQFPSKSNQCVKYQGNDLTNNRYFFEKFANHSLKCGPPTWGWIAASFAAHKELQKNKDKIQVPVLLLTSKDDRVVSSEAAKKFCQDLNAKTPHQCQHDEYEGMQHVLFHENDRKKVLNRIKKFRQDLTHNAHDNQED